MSPDARSNSQKSSSRKHRSTPSKASKVSSQRHSSDSPLDIAGIASSVVAAELTEVGATFLEECLQVSSPVGCEFNLYNLSYRLSSTSLLTRFARQAYDSPMLLISPQQSIFISTPVLSRTPHFRCYYYHQSNRHAYPRRHSTSLAWRTTSQ